MRSSPGTYRLRSRLWPALVVLLLVLQLFWPSRIWAALLGVMGGGWLIAFIWARSLARNLAVRRKTRYGWTRVGDQLEEQFVLSNASWLPATWLEVQDRSDLPGYNASRVTCLEAEGFSEWRSQGVCTRRGLFTIGPASLVGSDPLGMYSVSLPIPETATLLVLPPVLALPSIEVAPGGRVGEGRRHRRSALEMTVSSRSVRAYIPGDPLRAIHWPTSARQNQLFVRQFEQMPSSDWWICLDLNRNAQAGEGDLSTEEYGVILAASIADRGLRSGHSIGLVTCGQELVWIPPQRTAGQLVDILRALAMVRPGETPLDQLLSHLRPSLRTGASLILITPDLSPDWSGALLQSIRLGVTPTVLLLDQTSFGGQTPARGLADWFQRQGIASTIVTPDLLERPDPEGREGGTGNAIPARRPMQVEWRPRR